MSFDHFDPDFLQPAARPADGTAGEIARLRAARDAVAAGATLDGQVETVKQVLAAGETRPVNRREAELLFDMVEASGDRSACERFAGLFAAAIGNHVLAGGAERSPVLAQALGRAAWLEAAAMPDQRIDAVFARAVTAAMCEETVCEGEGWSARAASDALLRDVASAGAPGSSWVVARLQRRSALSVPEQRLIQFLEPVMPMTVAAPARAA